MYGVEYASKYHIGMVAIPCESKEKAEEIYNKIKGKIGRDYYELNKKGETTIIEVETSGGKYTVDVSAIFTVFIVNLDDEHGKEWEKTITERKQAINK